MQEDRLAAVREAARRSRAVVVLKGNQTLVAEPAADTTATATEPPAVWVCPTGNPGMATGGAGDVLTGIVAALLAQVGGPAAVRLAVYLHGLAGDLAAERLGELSLAALDLVDALPAAFAALRAELAGDG